jgi:4-amino-4-deoxy-L-arabinose transferase-like glycosyltransferase
VSLATPALVTQRAAQRLPRLALLLFCAAYLLPGLVGRDPWRNADLTTYATMLAMAEGRTSWLNPSLGGLAADVAVLPHALGAWAIQALGPLLDPALAARLPFALLLAGTLALIWYATFHLARTEAAQPLAFAFGGEAAPLDYARALADGALLATIASLGLLQLGHETTPELAQLCGVALWLWALAAAPYREVGSRAAALLSLPALASSGAPAVAVALGIVAVLICARSAYPQVHRLTLWWLGSSVLAALAAWGFGAWHWRVSAPDSGNEVLDVLKLLLWFTWPLWPMACWTLWQWRRQWLRRHISIPLGALAVGLGASLVMGGSDRALMLALPGLAVLAAFALPTLRRSAGALIDWFSVFFFSIAALSVWVIYSSMHLGVPAKPLANILRLAPGFVPSFSALALGAALLGTVAWIWLVRWRTSRNRHPLWKSLVLPASGVALTWLLTMTLWLPVLDYARSPKPWVQAIAKTVPAGQCVRAAGLSRPQVAALEAMGAYKVISAADAQSNLSQPCPWWLLNLRADQTAPQTPGWQLLGEARRPTDRQEKLLIYRQEGL